MNERSKANTVFYIFCVTALQQILLLAALASAIVFSQGINLNGYIIFISLPSVFAMFFLAFSVLIIYSNYTVSLFSRTRGELRDPGSFTTTRTDYYYGSKNLFTGNRPLYVRKREEAGAGKVAYFIIRAFLLSSIGVIHFIIETVRVLLSEERKEAWDEAHDAFCEQKEESGTWNFYKLYIIPLSVILILWIIFIPIKANYENTYTKDSLTFSISEKENFEMNAKTVTVYFHGEIENNGAEDVKFIDTEVFYKDRNGNTIASHLPYFKFVYNLQNNFTLESGKNCEFTFVVEIERNDPYAQALWNSELDDIEISIYIREIGWVGGESVKHSENKGYSVIKPLA